MTRPIAWRKRRAHVEPCKMKVGASAPPGELYLKEPAPPHQPRTARGTGHMVGRCTHRGSIPNIIAIACSCLPCRSVPRRHGSPPYLASRPPRCRPKQCRSRCGDAYGCRSRCGPNPGCGGPVDALGDHTLACPRTGLLARRAKVVERAWVRVAREAVGAEGQVVPQQWLTYTTAPGVLASDRRRLDLVVYGATAHGGALCCDATLVSPLTRTGHPQPCTAEVDGAALQVAERRKRVAYPELSRGGPQKLLVLGCEVGGRWSAGAQRFVRDLVRLRRCRASCRVCRLVEALVGNTLRGGPARRGVHSTWTPVAGGPATRTERRPLLGSCSRPCRAQGAQPSPPAALSRDRAWQRENIAVAPGFGDWGHFRAGIKVRWKKKLQVRWFAAGLSRGKGRCWPGQCRWYKP